MSEGRFRFPECVSWLLLILIVSTASVAFAADPHDLCRAATVRVRNGNVLGTGTIYHATDSNIYVLTNAHVVGTRLGTQVECELWRAGHQSRPVSGQTVAIAYVPSGYRDIAIIRIARQTLSGYSPPVVPLADDRIAVDYRKLFSVGCASGRWPTSFEGFALRRNQSTGDTIHFVPMPAGGRSGSALFDVSTDQPRIVGLVAWRSSDDGGHGMDGRGENHGYGIAMTHHEVWAGLRGQNQPTRQAAQQLTAPPGAIQVQHVENSSKAESEPPTANAPTSNNSVQPTATPQTGRPGDAILLYSDPVAAGPALHPPSAIDGGCENGRCYPPQGPSGDSLFPSLPNEQPPGPESARPSMAARDWLPWVIAGLAVVIVVGRWLVTTAGRLSEWFVGRIEQRVTSAVEKRTPVEYAPPPSTEEPK